MSEPQHPTRVHVTYQGADDPHAAREAVFAAAYEAMTGRPAEEFSGPRGWYVAEMVVRDDNGNPEVWARWTTEHPGRTGPAHLLNPNFRERLRRAGWHVSYLSPGAPLEPLAGQPEPSPRQVTRVQRSQLVRLTFPVDGCTCTQTGDGTRQPHPLTDRCPPCLVEEYVGGAWRPVG